MTAERRSLFHPFVASRLTQLESDMHNPVILTGDRPRRQTAHRPLRRIPAPARGRQHHYRQFVAIADLQALTDNGHKWPR